MPLRCDVPWTQQMPPHFEGHMAVPPNHSDLIGNIQFKITDLNGREIQTIPAHVESIASWGEFKRATGRWSYDLASSGRFHVTSIVYDKDGQELMRVAPRMMSVNWVPGY